MSVMGWLIVGLLSFGCLMIWSMAEDCRLTDLSPDAKHIYEAATREARELNHEYVGTEHLLLGWLNTQEPLAAQLGLDLARVRAEVEHLVHSGPDMITMGRLPLTPRAKRVFEIAATEAEARGSESVDGRHILLGLFRTSESLSWLVLDLAGLEMPMIEALLDD